MQQPSKMQVGANPGFLRIGTIISVNQSNFTARVQISSSQLGQSDQVNAQLPVSLMTSSGAMIGAYISSGTSVVLGQAESSGIYYIVAFLGKDPATSSNTTTIPSLSSQVFQPGQVIIQANVNGSILLDDDGIYIGEPQNAVTFDVDRNLFINTFDSAYTLTQGTREVIGPIKRDVRPSINFAQYLRSTDPTYDDTLKTIGMDPVAPARTSNLGNFIRNPARNEAREVVFEFQDDAQVQSNDIEIANYTQNSAPNQIDFNFIDRREGRADTLSLSLVSPNYLMESIKGSVVDIFGNLLDLNRNIIPIGQGNVSVSQIKTTLDATTFQNAYQQIKREERKNIAYHFELNAKKEEAIVTPPDVNNRTDYARARSRFSLDIDKEGQLKLNVPASSSYGNIPLLTRYENYSTINPNPKTNDPNDLMFNQNGGGGSTDILIESFINNPVITLVDSLSTNASPVDRFSPQGQTNYIQHGTVYHDITTICSSMQAGPTFYTPDEYTPFSELALGQVPGLQPVVSTKVQVSGSGANAGGRSASLNFDGSVEMNIGANQIDRQSLWLDTQGGIVASIGRDLPNNASILANTDGSVLLQVGGTPTPPDTRFASDPTANTAIASALDIRVWNGSEWTILRIDESGLTITAVSRITMVSNGDMSFISSGTMTLDAEIVNIRGRNHLPSGIPV